MSARAFFRDRLSIQNLLENESWESVVHPKSENINAAMPTSMSGINSSLNFEMGDNSNNATKQPVLNATAARSINEFKAHVSCRRNILTMWSPIPPGGRRVHSHHIDGPGIDQITGYDPTVIEFLAQR